MTRITLGAEVQYIITGFKGIATSRIEYLDGAVEYGVTPQQSDKGYPKVEWISDSRLQILGDGVHVKVDKRKAGFHVEGSV